MKKLTLTFSALLTFISCDTTFKVEKVLSENYKQVTTEIYLVSNLVNSRKVNDSILLNNIVSKRIKKLCETDNNIIGLSSYFYENTSCSKGYYDNYETNKGSESILDRCEDEYYSSYGYRYERLTGNNNNFYWHSIYPENLKDTIYCK